VKHVETYALLEWVNLEMELVAFDSYGVGELNGDNIWVNPG
jgi:hypothetical protein